MPFLPLFIYSAVVLGQYSSETEFSGESRSLDDFHDGHEHEGVYEHYAEVPHFVSYNLGIPADTKEAFMKKLQTEWFHVDHDESELHGVDEIAHMINEHASQTREHAYASADHHGDQNHLLSKEEYGRTFPYYYENKILPGNMLSFEQVNTDGNHYICIEELAKATLVGAKLDAQVWLDKGDKNHDGHLSLAEYLEVHENYWDKIASGHPHLEL